MSKKIKKFICAIDGGASSGKTTMAKLVGKKYNFSVLYSGLLFRYAAKMVMEKKPKNKVKFLKKKFSNINYEKVKKINLHTPKISSYSAIIAKEIKIRKIIKSFQKKYVQKKRRVVLEGRDMSQIFPNADVKFFVVCRPLKIAAKRRWLQIRKKKQKTSLKEVKKDLIKRDYLDKHRRHSPLVKASDSWYINTAKLNIKGVISKASLIIDRRIKSKYGS
tara:strand:+ start:1614 stop:2270 length:657 start_codon:yes stop_codon:yes gene_type:complete